jgi:hypothetical protein
VQGAEVCYSQLTFVWVQGAGPKEALRLTPATTRLLDMIDAGRAEGGGTPRTVGELVAAATAWLAAPMDGDAERVAARQAAKAALREAGAAEGKLAALLEGASAAATARLWRKARVVCCTASAAATLPLRLARAFAFEEKGGGEAEAGVQFEFVVLDEAAAMLEPDAVAALGHGARACLLVGDERQLPPFSKWREAKRQGYCNSLLERVVGGGGGLPPRGGGDGGGAGGGGGDWGGGGGASLGDYIVPAKGRGQKGGKARRGGGGGGGSGGGGGGGGGDGGGGGRQGGAAGPACCFALSEQYRMHPAICGTVSDAFYGGALRTPASVAAARPLAAPLWFVDYAAAGAGAAGYVLSCGCRGV